jgi:serine/threonine protein kinase
MPPFRFNPAALYPRASSTYHRFRSREGESSSAVFKKVQKPLDLLSSTGRPDLLTDGSTKLLTAREISICELLRSKPHPNIARYRGVECKSSLDFGTGSRAKRITLDTERVYRLVFKRYDCDLGQLVNSGKRFDVKYCLRSIEAGLVHMYSLGLVHVDIKPENIFVSKPSSKNSTYEFVIGDFDSTQKIGSRLELKGGDERWSKLGSNEMGKKVGPDNDWFNFQNLKLWLVGVIGGKVGDYDGIGKNMVGAKGPVWQGAGRWVYTPAEKKK